jgi:queuine tRNA-ribosyltransferase
VSFSFQLEATAGAARAGTLALPHGTVPTPAFMPVGTHGVVRGLSAADVRRTGARIILGNTYHLHLRPGESIVRDMGGLHRFTGWERPMLTDSGGFQVFSLEQLRTISESGVEFRSHVDGTWRRLTPERATEIQWDLGADIAMAFDHVVPGGAPRELAEEGRSMRGWRTGAQAHRRTVGTPPHRRRPPVRPCVRAPVRPSPSGPSSRAAPTTTSGSARSRASSPAARGPASRSGGCR